MPAAIYRRVSTDRCTDSLLCGLRAGFAFHMYQFGYTDRRYSRQRDCGLSIRGVKSFDIDSQGYINNAVSQIDLINLVSSAIVYVSDKSEIGLSRLCISP